MAVVPFADVVGFVVTDDNVEVVVAVVVWSVVPVAVAVAVEEEGTRELWRVNVHPPPGWFAPPSAVRGAS